MTSRPVESLADLTESEAEQLGLLIPSVSVALIDLTGCAKTYLAQFALLQCAGR